MGGWAQTGIQSRHLGWKWLPQAIRFACGTDCSVCRAWAGPRSTTHWKTDNAGDGDVTGQGDGNATLLQPSNPPRVRGSAVQAPPLVNVTTYHFDNRCNGWSNAEAVLHPVNVAGASSTDLYSVPLDEQVDAQSLVPERRLRRDREDTIYAIDGTSGAVPQTRNFWPARPRWGHSPASGNKSAGVGINSTLVISSATGTMYVMVYTPEEPGPGVPPACHQSEQPRPT